MHWRMPHSSVNAYAFVYIPGAASAALAGLTQKKSTDIDKAVNNAKSSGLRRPPIEGGCPIGFIVYREQQVARCIPLGENISSFMLEPFPDIKSASELYVCVKFAKDPYS